MMMKQIKPCIYKVTGNSTIDYNGEVLFPINGLLSHALRKGDEVKVVLLKKEDIGGNSDKNADKFICELDGINVGIGAKIEYKILSTPHNESREVQEKLLREMVDELSEGVSIYADITFGPKSLPIIVFSVLNFAIKFFNAEIINIVYGKVDFDKDNRPINPELFDMTALFYLNSIANTIECKDCNAAKKLLETLLS